MLGIAFFSSYFWHNVKLPNVILNLFQDLTRKQIPKQVRNDTKNLIIILAIFVLLIINAKYFQGKTISKSTYEKKYLSQKYIQEEAAFQIPEYFSNFPKNKEKSFNNIPIELINNQTTIEKISNLITLLTFLFLGFILINKQLWKKITN